MNSAAVVVLLPKSEPQGRPRIQDRKIARSQNRQKRKRKEKTNGNTNKFQGARGEELEGDTGRLGGKAPGSIGESALHFNRRRSPSSAMLPFIANANGTHHPTVAN